MNQISSIQSQINELKYYANIYDQEFRMIYNSYWGECYIEYGPYYAEDRKQLARFRDIGFKEVISKHFNQYEYTEFKETMKRLSKAQWGKSVVEFINKYYSNANVPSVDDDEIIIPKSELGVKRYEAIFSKLIS